MAEEPPITTNPFPVPIEETAPKWWLEDPEPMRRVSWLDIIVAIMVIYVGGGLMMSSLFDPHIYCGRPHYRDEDTWNTTDSADYPLEPFLSNDNAVEYDPAENNL